MPFVLTPRQVADSLGVSESSLKRWCDQGRLPSVRTAGGHRRLSLAGVVAYLRETGHQLARPESIGLPKSITLGNVDAARHAKHLSDELIADRFDESKRLLCDLYLRGNELSWMVDQVVRPACAEIGDCWRRGEVDVFQERRAIQILHGIAHEFRQFISEPDPKAPLAIGAAPEGDPYSLPTSVIELVLYREGFRARSLGWNVPFASMLKAVVDLRPAVFWLSVSFVADEQQFVDDANKFFRDFPASTLLAVGGNGLTPALQRRLDVNPCCENMQQLVRGVRHLLPK